MIQDIDGADVGYGAFWGEVQSNVHKALGCLGVITDGSIRDIPQWAPGFQALAGSIGPSHAWVHAENFGGEVRVAGMTVRSDDLIHADQHGAIVIPHRYRRKDARRLRTLRPPRDADPGDRAQPGLLAGEAERRAEAFGRNSLTKKPKTPGSTGGKYESFCALLRWRSCRHRRRAGANLSVAPDHAGRAVPAGRIDRRRGAHHGRADARRRSASRS